MATVQWKLVVLLGLLAGGTGLGMVLATFIDATPRALDGAPVQDSARPTFGYAQPRLRIDPRPEDLSPFTTRGISAQHTPADAMPDWADDGTLWDYPEPKLEPWEPAPYPSLADLQAPRSADAATPEAASGEAGASATGADAGTTEPDRARAPVEGPRRPGSRLAGLY